MKHPIAVSNASGACSFELGRDPAGRRRTCPFKAAIRLDGVALCDHHAEYAMTAACGRDTKIRRGA